MEDASGGAAIPRLMQRAKSSESVPGAPVTDSSQRSHALEDRGEQITNLQAYLFQTYKRLVQAELEKLRARERLLAERADEVSQNGHNGSAELDQSILIEELRRRMNQRTRQVFDLLALGHTFEEIGSMMGKSARAIRNNYYEQVARLKEELS